MRATLKFDLEEPDDRQAHLRCTKALEMSLLLWKIEQHYRNNDDLSMEDFNNLVTSFNINIEELSN